MSDRYRYDRQKIETLLPACWDDEFGILASKAEQVGSSHPDPRRSGDIIALVADVRRAWDLLDKDQHEILHARYHHELSLEAITELAGLESVQEAADLVSLAVQDMINTLGG